MSRTVIVRLGKFATADFLRGGTQASSSVMRADSW